MQALLLFFVRYQGPVFSIPLSVSKLQGQHFGGPSFAFPFPGTSGQFWEQLSCAWKMSSAFGNYTFLLTPGVLSWATSMTHRWEEVQLGRHKWFIRAYWAGPSGGKAVLIASSRKNQKSPKPPWSSQLPSGQTITLWVLPHIIYLVFPPAACDSNPWVNQSLHFFSACDYENFQTWRKVGGVIQTKKTTWFQQLLSFCGICLIYKEI